MTQLPHRAVAGVESAAAAADVIMRLEPVSLEQLGAAGLMNRFDTKYIFAASMLTEVLGRCADDYHVLEVDGRRSFRYRTQYFDTHDLRFYHMHHGARATRHKVRVRSYVDRDERFLEVKTKTNKDRTSKIRIALRPGAAPLEPLRRPPFMDLGVLVSVPDLREIVTVDYLRLTLVRSAHAERVTIDTRLEFAADGSTTAYPSLAIAEIKQHWRGASPFRELMRELRLRDVAISKYCLGIMSQRPQVKRNRFKHVLNRIERISMPQALSSLSATGNGHE